MVSRLARQPGLCARDRPKRQLGERRGKERLTAAFDALFQFLGNCVVASPAALLAALGLMSMFHRAASEAMIARLTQTSVVLGLFAAVAILILMLMLDTRHVPIELGDWVLIPQEHFHFKLEFVFDRLSVPFVILTY